MTKDTEKAFVIIYSEYLRRRSFGTAKSQAVRFDRAKLYAIDAFSNWNPEDIRYCLRELKQCGYVSIDIFGDLEILRGGIDYMENKPNEYFCKFASIVTDLLSLVSSFRPV